MHSTLRLFAWGSTVDRLYYFHLPSGSCDEAEGLPTFNAATKSVSTRYYRTGASGECSNQPPKVIRSYIHANPQINYFQSPLQTHSEATMTGSGDVSSLFLLASSMNSSICSALTKLSLVGRGVL